MINDTLLQRHRIEHPRGNPRSIQKVDADLRAPIIEEVVERLNRSMAARRSSRYQNQQQSMLLDIYPMRIKHPLNKFSKPARRALIVAIFLLSATSSAQAEEFNNSTETKAAKRDTQPYHPLNPSIRLTSFTISGTAASLGECP
jgi:hypothetical protein